MFNILRSLLVAYLSLCLIGASTSTRAQTQTTPNLIYSTVNPAPTGASYSWTGFSVTESQGGGLSGGNVPGYNTSSGQFMFGYAQGTIEYAIALNSVLSGTGIQLGGIEYGLQYFNQDYSRGTLSTTINLLNKQGTVLESYYHNLPQTTEGWTNFDQTKTFTNPYLLSNLGNATASVTGKDDRFWAGYYGPQFRNPYMRFTYNVDQCAANPLSSTDCPGYAAAYFNQQCTISPLFNATCPGYNLAYKTQQCSINPLYDPTCPGYEQAYFNYQCQQNGLYSTQCSNYAEAYAKKNILNVSSTSTTTSTDTTSTSTTTTANTNPVSIATTSTTTSTTSPTSMTSVTSVVSSPAPSNTTSPSAIATSPTPAPSNTTSPGATTDAKKTDAEVKSATSGPSGGDSGKNDSGKGGSSGGNSGGSMKARVEARAKEVAKEAGNAKTFEDQAKTQGLVVGLMGYVPGFDAYSNAKIVDINQLQMARLYNKPTVDNRRLLRGLTGASDRLHNEMVDQQYQLGK